MVTGCGTEPEVKPLIMEYFLFEIVKENFVVMAREENGQIVAFGRFLGKGQTCHFCRMCQHIVSNRMMGG